MLFRSLYFYHVFSLPFLPLRFLFFCSLIFSFFLTLLSVDSSSLFLATSFPFILLDSIGFLIFVPKTSPTVFSFLWASLQDYPLNCWLLGYYLYSKCACCTTLHSKTKLFVLSLPLPLSALPKWMRIGSSLSTYPYGMHQVVLAPCLPLLGEMLS